ncbi:MAG: hypothetical protein WAL47_09270, partial [Pyrinomonadaceae bacterium]
GHVLADSYGYLNRGWRPVKTLLRFVGAAGQKQAQGDCEESDFREIQHGSIVFHLACISLVGVGWGNS